MSAADIHRESLKVYGTDAMSRQQVTKWHLTFAPGRGNTTDVSRCERRSSSTADVNTERAEELVQTDRVELSGVWRLSLVYPITHIMLHVFTVLVCATGRLVL